MARKELLQSFKGKESITQAGRKINVYANIGHTDDLAAVLANDAEGIGLFRSEFLYLERDDYPTEEQQFEQYKKVAEALAGKRVIIRTLDIGADKQADYFHLPPEANPALGYRAVRICLKQEEIFRTQFACHLSCLCLWQGCSDVSDDYCCGGSTPMKKRFCRRYRQNWHRNRFPLLRIWKSVL